MHQKHKAKRKTKRGKESRLERLLSSRLFIVLGVAFLLIGMYYSFNSSEGSNNIYDILMKLLSPSSGEPVNEVTGQGLMTILLYFLPALLGLIGSSIYYKKYNLITHPASLIIAIYLVVIQSVLTFNSLYGGCFYPNFIVASVFLFFSTLLLLIAAFLHRKSLQLIFTCFYFYTSVLLYGVNYGMRIEYLLAFNLIFSIGIYFVSQKINRPHTNFINFLFAIAFFGLFWLRKFVVNSKPDFLVLFFIIGTLLYLLFYAINIFASNTEKNPLRKSIQLVFTWSNLLFFLGTTTFVLLKYYSFAYLWIFVLALFLFNILGLNLLKRFNSIAWVLPHHFSSIFLATLVLPLLMNQNMILLFTAGLTVSMLFYAKTYKAKAAMWISLVSMVIMSVCYLFYWINTYLPAIVIAKIILPNGLMIWHGVISGLAVVIALLASRWLLKEAEIPLSKKWLRKNTYNRLIRGELLFSLFFTFGWIGFSLLNQLTGTFNYFSVGWFITGSLFFISLIIYYAGNNHSFFKKPILYFSLFFVLLYPLLVNWNMSIYINNLIFNGYLDAKVHLFHYLALGLLVILGIMCINRIHLRNSKNIIIQRGLEILTVVFLLFLLCSEYDSLSVLIASIGNISNNQFTVGANILELNQYLPYSIIIWVVAIIAFIWAIIKNMVFLRNFSLFLFLGILIKVFAYDFSTISTGGRSAVFFVVGIFLIGFAIFYPRLLKAKSKLLETEKNNQKTQ